MDSPVRVLPVPGGPERLDGVVSQKGERLERVAYSIMRPWPLPWIMSSKLCFWPGMLCSRIWGVGY